MAREITLNLKPKEAEALERFLARVSQEDVVDVCGSMPAAEISEICRTLFRLRGALQLLLGK